MTDLRFWLIFHMQDILNVAIFVGITVAFFVVFIPWAAVGSEIYRYATRAKSPLKVHSC